MVDLRIGERPVAAKGLQRPFGDVQQLADLLVVQPRLRLADAVRMAERVHPSGELLEPRKHPLEGSGFYIDYSHGNVVLRSRERVWIRLQTPDRNLFIKACEVVFQHAIQIAVHRDFVVVDEPYNPLNPLVKLRTNINGLAVESRGLDRQQEETLVVRNFSR